MSNFWTQPRSKDVYIYFGIIIFLIIIYGLAILLFYGKNFYDNEILNNKIGDLPVIGTFGGWSISHIIAFYIAGFLFPEQWVLIFILGVFWEFIEVLTGDLMGQFMMDEGDKTNENGMYKNQWANGNLSDIWSNSIGLFLGYLTIMTIRENRKNKTSLNVPLS